MGTTCKNPPRVPTLTVQWRLGLLIFSKREAKRTSGEPSRLRLSSTRVRGAYGECLFWTQCVTWCQVGEASDPIIATLHTLTQMWQNRYAGGNFWVLYPFWVHLFSGYSIFEMLFLYFKKNSTFKLLYPSSSMVQRFKSAAPRNDQVQKWEQHAKIPPAYRL